MDYCSKEYGVSLLIAGEWVEPWCMKDNGHDGEHLYHGQDDMVWSDPEMVR